MRRLTNRFAIWQLAFTVAALTSACGSTDEPAATLSVGEVTRGVSREAETDQSVAAADTMLLSESELQVLREAAGRGDTVSAHRLGIHYLFFSNETEGLAIYWFSVAAERGHGLAMRAVASRLYKSGGQANCEQALVLMKRSATAPIEPSTTEDVNSWLATIRSHCVSGFR